MGPQPISRNGSTSSRRSSRQARNSTHGIEAPEYQSHTQLDPRNTSSLERTSNRSKNPKWLHPSGWEARSSGSSRAPSPGSACSIDNKVWLHIQQPDHTNRAVSSLGPKTPSVVRSEGRHNPNSRSHKALSRHRCSSCCSISAPPPSTVSCQIDQPEAGHKDTAEPLRPSARPAVLHHKPPKTISATRDVLDSERIPLSRAQVSEDQLHEWLGEQCPTLEVRDRSVQTTLDRAEGAFAARRRYSVPYQDAQKPRGLSRTKSFPLPFNTCMNNPGNIAHGAPPMYIFEGVGNGMQSRRRAQPPGRGGRMRLTSNDDDDSQDDDASHDLNRKKPKSASEGRFHCVFLGHHTQKRGCVTRYDCISKLRRHHESHDFYYCTRCWRKDFGSSQQRKAHDNQNPQCAYRCKTESCPHWDQSPPNANLCKHNDGSRGDNSQLSQWRALFHLARPGEAVPDPGQYQDSRSTLAQADADIPHPSVQRMHGHAMQHPVSNTRGAVFQTMPSNFNSNAGHQTRSALDGLHATLSRPLRALERFRDRDIPLTPSEHEHLTAISGMLSSQFAHLGQYLDQIAQRHNTRSSQTTDRPTAQLSNVPQTYLQQTLDDQHISLGLQYTSPPAPVWNQMVGNLDDPILLHHMGHQQFSPDVTGSLPSNMNTMQQAEHLTSESHPDQTFSHFDGDMYGQGHNANPSGFNFPPL